MATASKPKSIAVHNAFDSVKVFSATMHPQREQLGDKITAWLRDNPGIEIVDKIVTQSSDEAFHCLTITFFYKG